MNPMQMSNSGAGPNGDESMEGPAHEAAEEMGGQGYGDLTPETVFEPDDRIKHILWNRISVLDEAELEMLDQMVSPENISMWLKLFPELSELLAQATAMDAVMGMSQEDIMAQQGGMMQTQQMPQQMPQQPSTGLAGQRLGG